MSGKCQLQHFRASSAGIFKTQEGRRHSPCKRVLEGLLEEKYRRGHGNRKPQVFNYSCGSGEGGRKTRSNPFNQGREREGRWSTLGQFEKCWFRLGRKLCVGCEDSYLAMLTLPEGVMWESEEGVTGGELSCEYLRPCKLN